MHQETTTNFSTEEFNKLEESLISEVTKNAKNTLESFKFAMIFHSNVTEEQQKETLKNLKEYRREYGLKNIKDYKKYTEDYLNYTY